MLFKSKKADMDKSKSKPQDLGIAYSVKRKKKKMAEGGAVSAKSEKRPMPSEEANDKAMVSRNSDIKAPHEDQWTDKPTERQALAKDSRKVQPIKHPRMVPSDAFSVKMRDQEDDLQESAKVNDGPQEQPPKADDEMDAKKSGTPPHKMKMMADGGSIAPLTPSEDEGAMYADEHDEEGQDRQGPMVSDMEEPHNSEQDKVYGFADGGAIDEDELEHAASIAAAIMAKRKKFARGGEILSEDSMESDDSDMADLSRNAEEDANMEDKASFNALRKENYSESAGLEKLDQPHDSNLKGDSREDGEENIHDSDIVSAIRRKMKMKSPISR